MAAIRRSFSDPLESFIYWDSSFAVARADPSDPWHSECVQFGSWMQAQGVLCVVSELVYDELAFHIIKRALTQEARRTGEHWMDIKRGRPDLIVTTMSEVEAKWNDLNQITISLDLTEATRPRALQLMRDFALLPTNAYHIGIPLGEGINAFASLDEDLLTVDGIIVYTCVP